MTDNVDYNDLKRLIKIRTTRGQGEALTIPGHENEAKALHTFENEFYTELKDQHQRVDLFVQSKAGEVQRRLVHLDKQVGHLQQRYASHPTGKISVKRLERFSRAEEAVEKAGEEIQSLARFVGAQRLAFLKLLKKYRKWTGSPGLETRFRKKVLDKPGAFSTRDFQPLLTQYTNVLVAVRAPFEHGADAVPAQPNSKNPQKDVLSELDGDSSRAPKSPAQHTSPHDRAISRNATSIAAEIQNACQERSDIEFDTALATSPLGRSGGKASYWVHPDYLVELHVLLLQYTRLWRTAGPNPGNPTNNGSGRQSRRESTNANGNGLISGGEDDAGLVICDELENFARRRSSAPISDAGESVGTVPEKAFATIRYNSNGEAVLAVDTSSPNAASLRAPDTFAIIKLKRKAVRHLFNSAEPQCTADRLLRDEHSRGNYQEGDDLRSIRRWLPGYQEIQPLVQVQCKRTRFVGLRNGEAGGMWATLDRDILMRRTTEGFFSSKDGDLAFVDPEGSEWSRFPFAVLEVRFEGNFGTAFLDVLDKTHLTERIRGFLMGAHAVATLCKPQGMPPPYWLPALDQDIRKIPAAVKTTLSCESSSRQSPSPASAHRTSTSATSVGDRPTSSGFSAPPIGSSATSIWEIPESVPQKALKKERRRREDRPLHQQIQQPSHRRYWNEYDDGDETSDNEPFAIYINPNTSTSFPGFSTVSKAASSLAPQAKHSLKRVKSWLGFSDGPHSKTSLLIDGAASPEDNSDLEASPIDPLINRHRSYRRYSTFRDRYVVDHGFQGRESLLRRCCITFFIASYVLLILAFCLTSVGRRKAIFKVDVGVITGVVFSLVFAIAGVGCTLKQAEKVGYLRRAIMFAALMVVCVGTGVLLAGVVDG